MKMQYEKELQAVQLETQRLEWLRFIEFVSRHKDQAALAKEVVYFSEMDSALKNAENWYRKIFGDDIEAGLQEIEKDRLGQLP